MRFPAILSVVLQLVVAGCRSDDSVSPRLPTPESTRASAVLPSRDAQVSGGRPLSGQCALTTLATVPYPAPPLFRQTVSGECQLAHLGRVSVWFVQVVNFATHTQSSLELAYTAANGDVLLASSAGTNAPNTTGGVSFSATVTFVGGTGRFANATGRAQVEGSANIAAGTSQYVLDGFIDYNGADRAAIGVRHGSDPDFILPTQGDRLDHEADTNSRAPDAFAFS